MALIPQLIRQRPRHPLQRRLGRTVHAEILEPGARGDGADVDDAPGGTKMRDHGPNQQERRAHVQIKHTRIIIGRDLRDGFRHLCAGVVHQDIDMRAEGGEGRGDDLSGR